MAGASAGRDGPGHGACGPQRVGFGEEMSRKPVREDDRKVLLAIAAALEGLKYGSVEVTVQDSKVIQINRMEKFRLDAQGRPGVAGTSKNCVSREL